MPSLTARLSFLGVVQKENACLGRTRFAGASPATQTSTALNSTAECLPDKRVVEGATPSGRTVIEAELAQARGRDPRRNGCKSHRSPYRRALLARASEPMFDGDR